MRKFIATTIVTCACVVASLMSMSIHAADESKPAPLSKEAVAELAKAVEHLNAIALKFDLDKNQNLSTTEQAEIIKFVTEKFGKAWGVRTRQFLDSADLDVDGTVTLAEWERSIERLRSSQKLPDPSATGDLPHETFRVAMSDNVHLATDVYLPEGKGPFPVVFSRTPYHRVKLAPTFSRSIVPRGFALVVQDMRGRFDSEGGNLPFVGCGWGEHRDGTDSLAWIQKQPWCNGKIVTVGGSAGGITQSLMAGAAPTGLTAQHISVAVTSMYHQATYVGGAFRKCQVESWSSSNRFDPRATQLALEHPSYDDYWRQYDTSLKFSEMTVPAMHVGGWFDTFSQGTIDSFVGRQHSGGDGARGKQKLVMGPWTHAVGDNQKDAELVFPNPKSPQRYDIGRWLEYHLKGTENGMMDEPAVAYYTMGDTLETNAPGNQWRFASDWPVSSRATPYYFNQNGELGLQKPTIAKAVREYTFDPANPCPTLGGNNLTITRGPRNQNKIESRSDVLLFTTPVLEQPVEVTGRVAAKVYVASSAVDSDLSIRLCDVYPDGRSFNIAEGMLRLRYHKSLEKPELLTPGEVIDVEVDCWSTSMVFNRGHRLRVTVTSSNYPRFDINPGTGKPFREGDATVKQTNRIFCDAAHPSAIILPVVDGNSVAK